MQAWLLWMMCCKTFGCLIDASMVIMDDVLQDIGMPGIIVCTIDDV